ncbi:MAG: recombination protein RecR [Bacilli bacterium]|nr:recombination protein RecR [Bacilli bacterium]
MYPDSLKELIESFKFLPGIGEKSAERMAFYILDLDEEKVEYFSDSLKNVKTKIKKCPVCSNITEGDLCSICADDSRNKDLLCVLEDKKNIFLFEKLGSYNGYYHVLDNLIDPLNGINPEDIGLEKLINRIKEGNFKEIIIAVKPSIEGETTSLYIKKILEGMNVKVTRIASGIPIGADMEYIDAITLERALTDRKEIN